MRLFLLIALLISFTSGFSQQAELEIERLLNEQSKRALSAILLLERAEGESPKVLLYKSRYFQNLGEIEKSMILAQKGLSRKGSLLSAEFNKQLMIGHYLLGRTDSTIYYGQKLLGYTISKTEQAKANILIANAHWSLGNSTYAKGGYERALILSKETRDSNSISSSQNGLGLIYFQTENKLNEARSYFNEAVKYTPVNRPSNKANYLVNLSSVLIKQNRLDSALLILEKSEKIASTIGDKGILFSCFVNKGVILLSQNKLELAENNFKNAFTLIAAVGVNPIDVESLYLSWSDLEYKKGLFKSSRDYFKKYFELHEKRLNDEKSKKILLLQEQYNSAEKQKQIIELEVKQKKSELKERELDAAYVKAQLFYISALALFIILAIVIYVFYKRRKLENERVLEKDKRKAILEAVEKEKYRFSRELHDSLGGTLSMSKLMASQLSDEDVSSKIGQLLQIAIDDTRRISRDLYPTVLKVSGLKAALENLFDNLRISNPTVEFDFDMYDPPLKLSDSFSLHMYRVCQELTNNTIKYAQAKNVVLEIDFQSQNMFLRYRDNGVGIDMNTYKTGVGMNSIQERLANFNSSIDITSSVGKGFEIIIESEIEKAEE